MVDCPNIKCPLIADTQKCWIKINNTRSRKRKGRRNGRDKEEIG